jgi:hypothetical protein
MTHQTRIRIRVRREYKEIPLLTTLLVTLMPHQTLAPRRHKRQIKKLGTWVNYSRALSSGY